MKQGFLVLLVLGAFPLLSPAEEPKFRERATLVLTQQGNVLVTVKMTVVHRTLIEKKEVHKTEHPVEVAGTVVSAEGLVVISASALDFLPGLAIVPLGQEAIKTEFERQGARIRFADGQEVAAQLLGRDSARDLAFLKPMEKRDKVPHLSLDEQRALRPADPVILLYPLTRLLRRQPAVSLCSVAAIADHAGKLAVLDTSTLRHLGCPVFNAAGQFAGIATTLRPQQTPHEVLSNFENLEPDIVVMDAAAVRMAWAEVEKQARARKEK